MQSHIVKIAFVCPCIVVSSISYIMSRIRSNIYVRTGESGLTCIKSASPLALKNHSMVAELTTSLRLLHEMQPSLKPFPATASVSESTSAQAP